MKIPALLFSNVAKDFDKMMDDTKEEFRKKGVSESKLAEVMDEEVMNDLIGKYNEFFVKTAMENTDRNYERFYQTHLKNQQTISDKHRNTFSYFFGYLNAGFTVYESIRKFTINKKIEHADKIIIPFYGIVFRMADQIGLMLLNGYNDGALRLWRSCYEYAVSLLVFLKHTDDKDLFDRFADHQFRSRQKKTKSFVKNAAALKWNPLDEQTLKDLDERIKEIDEKYGKEFLESEFGWAKLLIPTTSRTTMRDMEDHVELSRFRPFYIQTAEYVHPNFTSIEHFMEDNALYIGRITSQEEDFRSMIDPLQFTLGILDEVNIVFLEHYSAEEESPINYLMFRRLYESMMATMNIDQ